MRDWELGISGFGIMRERFGWVGLIGVFSLWGFTLQDCDYLFQFYIVDVQFDLPWHVKNNVFLLVYFDFRNQPINILQQKLESVNKTSIRTYLINFSELVDLLPYCYI
jgi:hypothetical protein